jgi:type I restriction enzyme S subunit
MTELAIRTMKIGDHVSRVSTWNPGRDANGQIITYIDLSSIDNSEKSIIGHQNIPAADAPSRARQLVHTGDILVSTVRPNLNGVARVPDSLDGATASTGFCVLRPANGTLASEYLFHWVRSPLFVGDMVRKATGASYPAVSDKIILNSEIPLPLIDEQRRIAAILDQVDALRRKRWETLELLGKLKQSVFVRLFMTNDSLTRWPTAELGSLCELVRGSSPRPQGDPRYFGGPVPRLMIADITRDGMMVTPSIDSLTDEGAKRSRSMRAGSVVMAVSGAIGLPAILKIDACIHDGFVGFRKLDHRIKPQFLYYYLLLARERNSSKGTGAIWINLTTDQVSRFVLPLPPQELQKSFAEQLEKIESVKSLQTAHLLRSESLFASLQHRAFRGEL